MTPELKDWVRREDAAVGVDTLPIELQNLFWDIEGFLETFQARCEERIKGKEAPPILYQYTSLPGLMGICQTGKIWLTDADFLNDPLEGAWAQQRAEDLIGKYIQDDCGELATVCQKAVGWVLRPYDQRIRHEEDAYEYDLIGIAASSSATAFIASFSEDGDVLSQWRGYGDNAAGASIGLDLRDIDLCHVLNTLGRTTPVTLMRVEYDQAIQDTEIAFVFERLRDIWQRHHHILREHEDAMRFMHANFSGALHKVFTRLRWEFKSPAYSEEREWRLCVADFVVRATAFRANGNLIIPYTTTDIPQREGDWAFDEIILGPRCDGRVAKSLLGLLGTHRKPSIKRSKLAYR